MVIISWKVVLQDIIEQLKSQYNRSMAWTIWIKASTLEKQKFLTLLRCIKWILPMNWWRYKKPLPLPLLQTLMNLKQGFSWINYDGRKSKWRRERKRGKLIFDENKRSEMMRYGKISSRWLERERKNRSWSYKKFPV